VVGLVGRVQSEGRTRSRENGARRWPGREQGFMAGFPLTREEDGMILKFVLQRIGSCTE